MSFYRTLSSFITGFGIGNYITIKSEIKNDNIEKLSYSPLINPRAQKIVQDEIVDMIVSRSDNISAPDNSSSSMASFTILSFGAGILAVGALIYNIYHGLDCDLNSNISMDDDINSDADINKLFDESDGSNVLQGDSKDDSVSIE